MRGRIIIDREKCIGCGLCAEDCVGCHIYMEEPTPGVCKAVAKDEKCIVCGHCYAICPVEAVSIDGYDCTSNDTYSMTEFDSDKLLAAMKSRRSIRHFTEDPVSDSNIEMILEAGRYCPTAVNYQTVNYLVLKSDEAASPLHELDLRGRKVYIDACERGEAWAKSAKLVPMDESFFFRSAPLVIIVYSRSAVDASLASAYMELMAESLGLGVLYVGRFIRAMKMSGSMSEELGIVEPYEPVTCLAIGHPDPKFNYLRIPPRKKNY